MCRLCRTVFFFEKTSRMMLVDDEWGQLKSRDPMDGTFNIINIKLPLTFFVCIQETGASGTTCHSRQSSRNRLEGGISKK
jgi:hypothetical protein